MRREGSLLAAQFEYHAVGALVEPPDRVRFAPHPFDVVCGGPWHGCIKERPIPESNIGDEAERLPRRSFSDRGADCEGDMFVEPVKNERALLLDNLRDIIRDVHAVLPCPARLIARAAARRDRNPKRASWCLSPGSRRRRAAAGRAAALRNLPSRRRSLPRVAGSSSRYCRRALPN